MTKLDKKSRRQMIFRKLDIRFSKLHHLPLARFLRKNFKFMGSAHLVKKVLFKLFPFISPQSCQNLAAIVSLYLRRQALTATLRDFRKPKLIPLRNISSNAFPHSIPSSSTFNFNAFSRLAFVRPSLQARYARFPRTFDTFFPLLLFQSYLTALSPLSSILDTLIHFSATRWLNAWSSFASVYGSFYETPQLQLYIRSYSNLKKPLKHFVRFRFKGPKLALVLTDENIRETHFFLSPGLFLKYFGRQKALKKTKTLKFLLMKFLRKLLVILKLKYVVLHFRGTPVLIDLLLQVLYQPISHPMRDPLTGRFIDETDNWIQNLKISEVMFSRPKPFGYLKTRKKGRIKRKIRRKIIRSSNVVDEM